MPFEIKFYPSIKQIPIDLTTWDTYCSNPFSKPSLFKIFESSKTIGDKSGWNPLYFAVFKGEEIIAIHYSFLKTHSYGEYIFDWAWADFYARNQLNYYPKLISAIPFSPINAPKTIVHPSHEASKKEVIKQINDELLNFTKSNNLSSYHHLFSQNDYSHPSFMKRISTQYHFYNLYKDFDDFLSHLKSRKRKNIKKERNAIVQSKIIIKHIEDEFSSNFYKEIYQLYIQTVDKKYSYAYLNEDFFKLLFEEYKEHLLVIAAYEDEQLIAMSLFFKSDDVLYGRYWGSYLNQNEFLHFELCYYQAMEYCFKNDIQLFEAGAQGEHKLMRGFKAVEILSHHFVCIDQIHQIIHKHVEAENIQTAEYIKHANDYLPYK